jgi:uncharacterized protein YigE (DUF2233 family)
MGVFRCPADEIMRGSLLPKIMASVLAVCGLLIFAGGRAVFTSETTPWKEAETGLFVAEFESTLEKNPYAITVVKIDPKNYSLRLFCASEHGKETLTAKQWCSRNRLLAAVNAGMFQEDGLTSVGYMKNFDYVNNPKLSKANTILAFNPVDDSTPEAQIIDRECQDFNKLRQKYQSFVQSIRMISCDRQNVWTNQNSRWSTLAVGTDMDGNILFMFGRTAHSVHDFIDILLSLPLSLKSAMYLEGGPQASLFLSTPRLTLERNGVGEGLSENGSFKFALPIPNVIGIVKKPRAQS